ncbi:hypothetical protein Hypma_014434 [Hypsizygus marmoreus]|uniref:Uncharacterized protein n=1 Tax=Hypsizygus marmoreus TaxID=39966 RepID=A0A369JJI9_HYPMA|nr:hypothetical protein Hypma_014434 [Hypsizygus marmoreus]
MNIDPASMKSSGKKDGKETCHLHSLHHYNHAFAHYIRCYYARIIKNNQLNLSTRPCTLSKCTKSTSPSGQYHFATAHDIQPPDIGRLITRKITKLRLIMTDETALLRVGDKIMDAPHGLGTVFEIRNSAMEGLKKILVWYQVDNSRAMTRELLIYLIPSRLVDMGESQSDTAERLLSG